jgi:hypothetical protein
MSSDLGLVLAPPLAAITGFLVSLTLWYFFELNLDKAIGIWIASTLQGLGIALSVAVFIEG